MFILMDGTELHRAKVCPLSRRERVGARGNGLSIILSPLTRPLRGRPLPKGAR